MLQKQKEVVLTLVKTAYENRKFTHHYLIPYEDFFDIEDDFTDFQCERKEGKIQYISLIKQLMDKDENAQIFVDVYGFEEFGSDTWIYADTLIVFSELSLFQMKHLLYMRDDVFPSDVGEIEDITEDYVVINGEGIMRPVHELCSSSVKVYFCWWD